jgi:electron transfer flavoprotein beta subunit
MDYDLILSGSQDDEDTSAHLIPAVAYKLRIQHATIVTKIQIEDHKATVQRELENDLEEILEIDLPAIFSVQSGINIPRYASMSGMMKAKKKELKFMDMESIGITKTDISDSAAKTILEEIYIPKVEQTAEILSGTIDEMTNQLLSVLIDKEVL